MSVDPTLPPQAPSAAAVPLAKRQRLQQLFDRANQSLKKGDFAYAHDLFAECVSEDPGALVYVQHLRANLAQMFPGPPKKSGGFSMLRGRRGAVSKHAGKSDFAAAMAAGCAALRRSPHDTIVLCEMADAVGKLGHTECQLYYLKWALEIAPNDVEVNRQAAAALEAAAMFEHAIGCWIRVQQQKPSDEEAAKAIARLSVEKTIDDGGYDPALLRPGAPAQESEFRVARLARTNRKPDSPEAPQAEGEAKPPATEAELLAAVENAPSDPASYARLAEFYAAKGKLQDAERLLRKALAAAGGGDLAILEKLEDVYMTRMKARAAEARRRSDRQPSEAARKLADQTLAEMNQAELEVYAARAERAPGDTRLQYELGLRLKRVGKHREAIEPLQAARSDSRRSSEAELHLGECFQHIGQHRLAMRSYEAALAAADGSTAPDLRKLALYRAGVLAMGLGDLGAAEKHLTDLASVDFGYRDVGDRLDKLARIRDST